MSTARTYLDHHASAPLLDVAKEAMIAAMGMVGNASSVHAEGRKLRALIEQARKDVGFACGAEAKTVVFTGSATEAITQAIVGAVRKFELDLVIVNHGEHRAVIAAAEMSGARVEYCPLDGSGRLDVDRLKAFLAAATAAELKALVAIHHVNGETGVVQDIGAIGAAVGASPHYMFVDGVQALGKAPIDFAASAIDMMALSGHKIGGPQGVGALVMKPHCDDVKIIPGGGQELGRRGGTEACALIAGFGAAAKVFPALAQQVIQNGLIARFEEGLLEISPDAHIFAQEAERIGTVSAFALPHVESAVGLMRTDLAGVAISSGSACSSGKVARSTLADALDAPEWAKKGMLRLSVGWNSTTQDIDRALEELRRIYADVSAKTKDKVA